MNLEKFQYKYDPEKLYTITPKRRDFKMMVAPRYLHHYLQNAYEDFTADLLLNHSKEGMFFIDIGAHYGFYTLLVATKHKNSKILALEPVPENYEIVKKNLELNNLENVKVFNLAVSNKDEIKRFNITEASDSFGFYQHPLTRTTKEIEVRAVTLDKFIKDIPKVPTIVKVGTEGHEIRVLEGMRNILKDCEDIKLFIEFDPTRLKNSGSQPEDLLEMVGKIGFDIYFIDDEQRETYKLDEEQVKNWGAFFGEGNFQKDYFNVFCTKKDKSLSVCFFSHSSQLAGAERSLLELVTDLIRDYGVICSVVLPNDGPLRKKLGEAGASTFNFNYDWWCDSSIPADEEITRRLNNSFKTTLEKIKEKVEKINPDVVFTRTMVIPWGAIIASRLNKPHVWLVNEFGRLDRGLKFYLPFQKVLEIIKDSSNIILTNSNAVKKELFGNTSEPNILTIGQHIDIPQNTIDEDKNDYFTRMDATKLIITGTISESKGQKDAILAVRELIKRKKDVELIIVGYSSSSYLEELKYLVEDENLEEYIRFIDFKENVYPIINQADIVLVCSRNEAFGRVTVEAMLLRKPVVGTNSGGTLELIKEGFNGLLYEPGNYSQLADRIEYLIENEEKIKEFEENGYKFVKEHFTKEEYGGRVYKLLMSIKNDRNPALSSYWQFVTRNTLHTLSNLEATIKDKEIHTSYLEALVSEKDGEIANLKNLKETINLIYNSHGWKALLTYYRLRDKILPINAIRRLFANVSGMSEPPLIKVEFERNISVESIEDLNFPYFERNISVESIEDLNFPYYDQPLVSIIIPVWNKWQYTYNCLKSILKNTEDVPYEIIVANDKSTDETSEMLKKIANINIINNEINLGFLKNSNNASEYAKGKYILFLNNDTEVKEGWLINLLKIAENDEKVGVVGGKLLYPDGRIQEAGGIIGKDGDGTPYGRNDAPDKYDYNYVKEVDCLIGACLLVRKNLFFELGKFDERYAPAFYEEFDMEFAIREAGYKVIYQPKSIILHYDNSSYGSEFRLKQTDLNRAKFIKKWGKQLLQQPDEVFLARDRSKNKKVILFIDDKLPDWDKHAGSLSTYQYITLLHEMGFKLIFVPDSLTPLEPYATELQQTGIEVLYGPLEFESWIEHNGKYIHYVWLSRPDVAIKYVMAIKHYTKAKILYYTVDLHYLRELRRYQIEKRKEILDESIRLKSIEFNLFKNVDVILTPSDQEQKIIKEAFPQKRIVTIPVIYYEANSIVEQILTDFDGRHGLIFLGGFNHLPNVDAVKWFISDIFPVIQGKLPEIKLYIVGSNPPPEITALNSHDIIVMGYVKDLEQIFKTKRVFVSPLRYGAGVKGKIITSMSYGVPVVTTRVGDEGINLRDGVEAFIADDPIEFANGTVELYTNPKTWIQLSKNSISFVKNNFSKDKAKHVMLEALDLE